MNIKKIESMKKRVEWILADFPEARNCDVELYFQYVNKYLHIGIHRDFQDNHFVSLYALKKFNYYSIVRLRQKIQSEGFYLPTDEAVAKQRKINMEVWRQAMSMDAVGNYIIGIGK